MATDPTTAHPSSIPPPQGPAGDQDDRITIVIPYWLLIVGLVVLLVSVLALLPGPAGSREPAVISGVFVDTSDNDATTITVEFNEPCSSERTETGVSEDARQVSVSIEVDRTCGFGLNLATTTLELEDPIGDRLIVNAETGEPLQQLDQPTDLSAIGPLPGQ